MPTRVPPVRTPIAPQQAIEATALAHERVIGRLPSPKTLAIEVAHSALESGQWGTAVPHGCICFNIGNQKGVHPRTGHFTMYPCNERLPEAQAKRDIETAPPREDGKGPSAVLQSKNDDGTWTVRFWPPHPQCVFRAFDTLEDAFQDYIEFLAIDTTPHNGKPNRYAAAWEAAMRGDLKDFVFKLHEAKYFTARPGFYYDGGDGPGGRPGILALYNQYLPQCQAYILPRNDADTEPPAPSEAELEVAFVALDEAEAAIGNARAALRRLA